MTIHYTKGEEWANTLSHGVGILIGIAGGGYLLLTAMKSGNPWATGGMWLYLFGMLSSYISSTWYHASKPSPHREVLRKFDHASIYLHIAGSYSPIMLIALREADYWGWGILSFVWLCALAGIILCFCNLKEHSNLETICYIAPDQLVGAILTLQLQKTTQPNGSVQCEVLAPQLHPTVTHYDAGKTNVRTYLLRDYTQELAAAHGVRANYSDFSLDRIQKIAQNNISASFLALT